MKINYDYENKKYYIETDKARDFLACGDRVKVGIKNGTIQFSKIINKNYYFQADHEFLNYIPLNLIQELERI